MTEIEKIALAVGHWVGKYNLLRGVGNVTIDIGFDTDVEKWTALKAIREEWDVANGLPPLDPEAEFEVRGVKVRITSREKHPPVAMRSGWRPW